MYRAPFLVGQRDDGRTLQARQHLDNLLQFGLRCIHTHIFLVLCLTDSLEAEEHVSQNLTLLLTQILVTDEQGLALHHHFHLAQVVAYQGRAAANDIKDTVGQTDTRTDLHATGNHMDVGIDSLLIQESAEDKGVGGSNLLTVEPLQSWILDALGDGQTQTALAEAQTLDDFSILVAFHELIFAYHTDIGHATGHTLRNIIITQVQYFEGEVR